jgi:hypothetical protein
LKRWVLVPAMVLCAVVVGIARSTPPARPGTVSAGTGATGSAPAFAEPVRLFNGRNLDGFYTYIRDRGRDQDPNHVFTVADGMIRVSGQEWGCLTTRDEFENYLLVVEYKWGSVTWPHRVKNARDSGILLHSVGEDGGYERTWMHSIECNVIEGGTGDFIVVGDGSDRYALTASVGKEQVAGCHYYDPKGAGGVATIHAGRLNWFARDPDWKDVKDFRGRHDVEKPAGEWNRVECLAAKDRIMIKLNGVLVNACRDVRPRRGRIQLQSEAAEIFFRRVELRRVPGDAHPGGELKTDSPGH